MIPAEDDPRDFHLCAAYIAKYGAADRGGAEEANERAHHSLVETDRQKEGYPTELWRERNNQARLRETSVSAGLLRRLRGYNQLVKGQRDRCRRHPSPCPF